MSNLYKLLGRLFGLLTILYFPASIMAQVPVITYVSEIGTGLNSPVYVTNAGDGSNRLFVVELGGTIKVRNGSTISQFADFSNIITTGGERGLLSMAFHPNYDGVTNRYFYIYYTDLTGFITISRYQTVVGNINAVDLSTRTNIITVSHPGSNTHNGGTLQFGPDGYLYFAVGDGGSSNDPPNNAQTGTVLLGKMVRIDVDHPSAAYGNYSVPADNPYVNDPNIDDRIWALGLRNPFRWSFDRLTGDVWIGDVGQNTLEEINFRPAGTTGHVNYGWHCFEGYQSTPNVPDCVPANYVPPVYDYDNPISGSSAVTGGYVYRGSEFPTLYGYYVAADVYSGDIILLWPNGSGRFDSSVQTNVQVQFVVGFGEGEDGTLYTVSQTENAVYKVVASGGVVLPVTLVSFSGMVSSGYNELKWKTSTEQNTAKFNIEYSTDGSSFTKAGTVLATGNGNGSDYAFKHYIGNQNKIFYRLAIEEVNGAIKYSSIISLSRRGDKKIRIYPTIVNSGAVTLELNGTKLNSFRITNTNGAVVFKKDLKDIAGTTTLYLPTLAKGVFLVEIIGDGIVQTERIVIQ
jgi:glucose/arabinose dehydrogenase